MSVNTLNFEQISTVLTSIVQQATGQAVAAPTDTGSFVSVAQIALRADRDSVMNAISNILGRTIFSARSYSASMTGLDMDSFRWGGVMRKLSICDDDWQDDPAFKYPVFYDAGQTPPDGLGGTVDPWKIKKPNVLQTNFYGQSVYFDEMTITERQIETAFSSPEELGSFLSLCMTNIQNRLEQSNEEIKRGLVCNAIGAIYDENQSDRVVKLMTMYNSATGQSYTKQDIFGANIWPDFCRWAYAVIDDKSDMMTKRSINYQTTITGKPVLRHTPKEMQRVYLYSPFMKQMEARVLSTTFHNDFFSKADTEAIPFWQSSKEGSRENLEVYPAYTDNTGTLVHKTGSGDEVTVNDVLGIMFDRDMMGMTLLDRQILATPLNTRGLYRNLHIHANQRVFFDNTEKGIIFLLA